MVYGTRKIVCNVLLRNYLNISNYTAYIIKDTRGGYIICQDLLCLSSVSLNSINTYIDIDVLRRHRFPNPRIHKS